MGGLIFKEYVTEILEFIESSRNYIKGSNPKCVFGSEKFLSTILAVRLDLIIMFN